MAVLEALRTHVDDYVTVAGLVLGRWANERFLDGTYPKKDVRLSHELEVTSTVLGGALVTRPSAGSACWRRIAECSDPARLTRTVDDPKHREVVLGIMERAATIADSRPNLIRLAGGSSIDPPKLLEAFKKVAIELIHELDAQDDRPATELDVAMADDQLRRLGVSGVQVRRSQLPAGGIDRHFDDCQTLEILAHNFRFTEIHRLTRLIDAFLQQPERHLYIALLDPNPDRGLYDAYLQARLRATDVPHPRQLADDTLNALLAFRRTLDPVVAERFALGAHDNLFGTAIFCDRTLPTGRGHVEFLYSDLDAANFTSLSLAHDPDPESVYQMYAGTAERIRARARVV